MKIKRRKRKKIFKLNNISIICCTLVVLLGATGVSYAYWNDNLNIKTKVSTGSIDPYFDTFDTNDNSKIVGNEKGNLDVLVEGDKIIITGDISPDYNENILLSISNSGSVPIKLKSVKNMNTDLLKQINVQDKIIKSNDNDSIICKLHIQPDKSVEPGVENGYSFKSKLLFDQFNHGGWQKELTVCVDVNVISEETTTLAGIELMAIGLLETDQVDAIQSELQESNEPESEPEENETIENQQDESENSLMDTHGINNVKPEQQKKGNKIDEQNEIQEPEIVQEDVKTPESEQEGTDEAEEGDEPESKSEKPEIQESELKQTETSENKPEEAETHKSKKKGTNEAESELEEKDDLTTDTNENGDVTHEPQRNGNTANESNEADTSETEPKGDEAPETVSQEAEDSESEPEEIETPKSEQKVTDELIGEPEETDETENKSEESEVIENEPDQTETPETKPEETDAPESEPKVGDILENE